MNIKDVSSAPGAAQAGSPGALSVGKASEEEDGAFGELLAAAAPKAQTANLDGRAAKQPAEGSRAQAPKSVESGVEAEVPSPKAANAKASAHSSAALDAVEAAVDPKGPKAIGKSKAAKPEAMVGMKAAMTAVKSAKAEVEEKAARPLAKSEDAEKTPVIMQWVQPIVVQCPVVDPSAMRVPAQFQQSPQYGLPLSLESVAALPRAHQGGAPTALVLADPVLIVDVEELAAAQARSLPLGALAMDSGALQGANLFGERTAPMAAVLSGQEPAYVGAEIPQTLLPWEARSPLFAHKLGEEYVSSRAESPVASRPLNAMPKGAQESARPPSRAAEAPSKDGARSVGGTEDVAMYLPSVSKQGGWSAGDRSDALGEAGAAPGATSFQAAAIVPAGTQAGAASREGGLAFSATGASRSASLQGSVDVYSPGLLAMKVGDLAARGGGTMRVKVMPESLGELTISVTSDGGKLKVELAPTSAEAREVLSSRLPELKGVLEASRFQVDRIDVTREASTASVAARTGAAGGSWSPASSSVSGALVGAFGNGMSSGSNGDGQSRDGFLQWDQYNSQWQDRMNREDRGQDRQNERARRLWQYESALA